MENQKIVEYIKQSLSQGRTKEEIYKELLNAGWSIDDIQDAFEEVSEKEEKEKTQKKAIYVILIIGVILVGAGIFSFIAANWQAIPRSIKLSMIILSMLAFYGGGWYFREIRGLKRTGEALLLLGAITYGAGIFLIAQIFNIRTNWPDGFILWMLGAIIMGLSIDSFPQFYLGVIAGIATIFGYFIDFARMFALSWAYSGIFFTSLTLLSIAAISTFITGYIIRRRIPPEEINKF